MGFELPFAIALGAWAISTTAAVAYRFLYVFKASEVARLREEVARLCNLVVLCDRVVESRSGSFADHGDLLEPLTRD